MKQGFKRKLGLIMLTIAALVLCVEMAVRLFLMTGVILYQSSDEFEYRMRPNQEIEFLERKIKVNELGCRGSSPAEKEKKVAWYCGDSVIHGGVHTDEDSLAVELWERWINHDGDSSWSALNISQGSWGPDNSFAFCNVHKSELGRPEVVILCLSSHDYKDHMTFCYSGASREMPSKKSTFLIAALYNKYFGPIQECPRVLNQKRNAGVSQWMEWSKQNTIDLKVYLHPTVSEIKDGEYNDLGKKTLRDFQDLDFEVYQGLGTLEVSDFRDNIHLSESGQRNLLSVFQGFDLN
jgi:hypothetical protein